MFINRIVLLISFIFLQLSITAQVVINEFSTSNTNNYNGGDEDWIELYNYSSATINIGGYYLSDDITNPIKWQIPIGTTLAPNGFKTILASDNNIVTGNILETNFKLTQCKNEWLTLADASGIVIDSYQMLVTTPAGHSRGRTIDGGGTWAYFGNPTPNGSNGSISFTGYAERPVFSLAPGFYAGNQSVSLTCSTPNVDIRYTTDGSTPTVLSNLYATPIPITQSTVVRAIAKPQSGSTLLTSLIETNTYFINITHTLPVISVSGNYGTVINGNTTFQPLSISDIVTSVEYFDVSQQLMWESLGEMRRHGNDSWAYPQKGIRFHSQDKYGYSHTVQYPLMQTSTRQKYDVFILKAAGNDNFPDGGSFASPVTHIRDVMAQTFAEKNGLNLDTRKYEPCILYVNGAYWGVYELRERIDNDYIKYYYGQSKKDVDMLRVWGGLNIDSGSDTAWYNLRDFVVNNNMAISANYQHVEDRLDISSFIDYFCYNQFLVNTDVFNWNTQWWRGRGGSGVKWRYALWDMDNTFDLGQNYTGIPSTDCNTSPCAYNNVLQNTTGTVTQPVMFTRLLQNPTFHALWANRYAYLNNNVFRCDKLIPHLDSLVNRISPEFPAHIARWGGSMAIWQTNLQNVRDFMTCRCNNILQLAVACDSLLTGLDTVCISMSPDSVGYVTFDSLIVTTDTICQTYFGGVNIPIYAVSTDTNYIFDYWELPDSTFRSNSNTSAFKVIQLNNSGPIVAHFKIDDGTSSTNKLLSERESISIIPNPNNGSFVIKCNDKSNLQKHVRIINSQGRLVKEFIVTNSTIEINENTLADGIYSVVVISDQHVSINKVVVRR